MREQIAQLQQELYNTLKQAHANRRKISFFRTLCYGGALLYFIGVIALQVFVFSTNDTSSLFAVNPDSSFWEKYKLLIIIAPLFVLIMLGGYGLSVYYRKYAEAEQKTIRRIIRAIFPDAKLALLPSDVSTLLLQQSNFFSGMKNLSGYSFGMVIFESNGTKITFRDMALNTNLQGNWFAQTAIGSYFFIFRMMLKGLFGARIENMTGNFRGMFANAYLKKAIKGSVVVLPDHLESHFDYLAPNIQVLKNVNGNKLVTLEDPEFERYFTVYASDEITARYVLTPAMMMRITELKKKYNRDIMLSFSGDAFYFAVAMPEGFLTLGTSSLVSGEALKDLYDNFLTAQEILNELRIN